MEYDKYCIIQRFKMFFDLEFQVKMFAPFFIILKKNLMIKGLI